MAAMRGIVGSSQARVDLPEKVTGVAKYTADIRMADMLYARVLRSPHPHARVLEVDASRAAALPGVHAVLTPFNVPPGSVASDLPILDSMVRFAGDEVAAVAAESPDAAAEAVDLLDVSYEPLPFVLDPEEALKLGAPLVHVTGNLVGGQPLVLERGDAAAGFAEADMVIEGTYRTPAHSGAALETRAALAAWDGDRLTLWKSTRGVHSDRATIARALGLTLEQVRVVGPHMGAGYGNKDETRLGLLAALLARNAGRPVRLEYTRAEEFVAGRTRHPSVTNMRVGVRNDGAITAIEARTLLDTGASAASGAGVLRRAGQGSLYLYRCPNARYVGHAAYTNRPAAGSYRGLGAPQGHFALDAHMDRVAEALGMDPLEFRLRNAVPLEGQPGQRQTPPGERMDTQPVEGGVPFSSNGLEECLRRGAEAIGWADRRTAPASGAGPVKRGIGVAMCAYRGGPGGQSSAQVRLTSQGGVEVVSGIIDVGEGAATVLCQMAAEVLGLTMEHVRPVLADTGITAAAPTTSGSTLTFSTGAAVKLAAEDLRGRIAGVAAPLLDTTPDNLVLSHARVQVRDQPERSITLSEIAAAVPAERLSAEATIAPGSTESIVNSFAAHFAEVAVDTETGQVTVERYVAVHDSGRIINPNLAVNQVEGGVNQMLGWTLGEELVQDLNTGGTVNANFLEHKCPSFLDAPPVEVIFADVVDPIGPFGAKALGEPPSVPVAAAVVNAVYNAVGVRFSALPLTPDRVLEALAS